MITRSVKAVVLFALVWWSSLEKEHTVLAVDDEESITRTYTCQCLAEISNCTTENLNNLLLYKCTCQEHENCTTSYYKSALIRSVTKSLNNSSVQSCGYRLDDDNCSDMHEAEAINSSIYLMDTSGIFQEKLTDISRNFECFDGSKGNCLRCFDLSDDPCNHSGGQPPAPQLLLNPAATSNNEKNSTPDSSSASTTENGTRTKCSNLTDGSNSTNQNSSINTSQSQNSTSTTCGNDTSTINQISSSTNTRTDNTTNTRTDNTTNTPTENTTNTPTDNTTNTPIDNTTNTPIDNTTNTPTDNTTNTPIDNTTKTNIPTTSQPATALLQTQDEQFNTVAMIIISAIVGVSLVLGVVVCSVMMYKRKKMDDNYKRQRKTRKNTSEDLNTSRSSEASQHYRRGIYSDHTTPKELFMD